MGALIEIWEKFISFFKQNDAARIMEFLQEMDWHSLLTNPVFWVVTVSVAGVMVWKKQLKMLVLLCSLAAFMVLLQATLPAGGDSMELSSILQFIGGSAVLAGLNLYFLFVRQ